MAPEGHSRAHFLHLGTKILETKVYRMVDRKRKIGGNNSPFESWSQKGMNNAIPNPAHLTKSCPEKDRRENYLVVSCMVSPGRVAQTADVFCYVCRQ